MSSVLRFPFPFPQIGLFESSWRSGGAL